MDKIRIRGLRKNYGEKNILDAFSYTFEEGKTYCIMGSSGCGKTTLLRIMAGLETYEADEFYCKENVGDELKVAMVFQEDRLCESYSVAANLRLGNASLKDEEIEEALAQAGLEGYASEKVGILSGGMKRRVAILRAMLAKTSLLLLDEPFQGLDEGTRAEIIALVKARADGRTMIVVTHEEEDVEALGAELIILKKEEEKNDKTD